MKIQVIGVHWGAYIQQGHLLSIKQPTAAMEYDAPLLNGVEEIQEWLDTHAGDFSEVMDFASWPEIAWQKEESEPFFLDAMYGTEEPND